MGAVERDIRKLAARRRRLKAGLKTILAPLSMPWAWVTGARRGPRVLFYHRVNDHDRMALGPVSAELSVRPADFEWQLDWLLRQGFRPVDLASFTAMIEGRQPADPRAVLLTFDDGYADNLHVAAPILARAGVPAVLFLATGFVGDDSGRRWRWGDPPGLGRFLTAAEVADLARSGIAIASHTVTHPRMPTCRDADLDTELSNSRDAIDKLAGACQSAFAYPEGCVDDRVEAAVRRAGYALAFTTVTGPVRPGDNPLRLRRTEVSATDSRFVFALKMRGALDWTRIKDEGLLRRLVTRLTDRALARGGG